MQDLLIRLHQFLQEHYDLEEFRTLCFSLGVEYDDLIGEGLSSKQRELVKWMHRRGRLNELLNALQRTRPDQQEIGQGIDTRDILRYNLACVSGFT